MNNDLRLKCCNLRALTSEDALSWMFKNYPPQDKSVSGDALSLIGHRSWASREQYFLYTGYFLNAFPFASPYPVKIFLKLMPLRRFLHQIQSSIASDWNNDLKKLTLALYFLKGEVRPTSECDISKFSLIVSSLEKRIFELSRSDLS